MQGWAKNNGIPFSRLIPLLDFCAVSIAADLVPVTDENRILAFHGLKQLNQKVNTFLSILHASRGIYAWTNPEDNVTHRQLSAV